MRQPDHEYEERSFGDIQRAIDFENSMNDLESQLYYQHLSPKEVAQQVLKATCQFYDADWCGLIQVDWLIQFSTKYHLSYMGAVSELLKQLDSLHSYDLLNQYAMKSLTIAPDNPKAYCWLIRSLKAQGMNELATNELAAAKEHLTTEEYEEILAFGANW